MNKYLTTGTATWTAATKTISAAVDLNTPFVTADATFQRQVFFRIGTSLYHGRVSTFVSVSSVTMLSVGSLPSADGVIDELFLYDLSEAHTYQQYVDQVKALVREDTTVKLASLDYDKLVAAAVTDYNRDKPFYVRKKIAGDGTKSYLLTSILGSLFLPGYSFIRSIEHPVGNVPPTVLDSSSWFIYDDGTAQDGTNLKLVFTNTTPSASQHFTTEVLTPIDLPTAGTQNFPDTDQNFSAITLRAAMYGCMALAAAYAQSTDGTISADVVNYHDKTNKYLQLAKTYKEQYEKFVTGTADGEEASTPAAFADKEVDLDSSMGGGFLFHGGPGR